MLPLGALPGPQQEFTQDQESKMAPQILKTLHGKQHHREPWRQSSVRSTPHVYSQYGLHLPTCQRFGQCPPRVQKWYGQQATRRTGTQALSLPTEAQSSPLPSSLLISSQGQLLTLPSPEPAQVAAPFLPNTRPAHSPPGAALRPPQLWGWGPPRVATPDFSMSFSASHPPPGLSLLRAPSAALLPATRTHACCRQTLHETGVGTESVWSGGLRPALSFQKGAASAPAAAVLGCAQTNQALPSKAAPTNGVRSEAGGARPASL